MVSKMHNFARVYIQKSKSFKWFSFFFCISIALIAKLFGNCFAQSLGFFFFRRWNLFVFSADSTIWYDSAFRKKQKFAKILANNKGPKLLLRGLDNYNPNTANPRGAGLMHKKMEVDYGWTANTVVAYSQVGKLQPVVPKIFQNCSLFTWFV